MPSFTAVLPWVYRPYFEACLATMAPEFARHCLIVDNSQHNIGIMRAHNLAIDKMRQDQTDWLVIVSAAIRFGSLGGLDFIEQLDATSINIGAADKAKWDGQKQVGIFGWHLIAFSKECIATVGKWDANFSPYGWDDIDYSIRMQQAFPDPDYSRRTKKVPCDVSDTTMAHSINLAGISTDNLHHIDYLHRKWNYNVGGDNRIERMYPHPFNDPTKPLSYWPTYEGASCL